MAAPTHQSILVQEYLSTCSWRGTLLDLMLEMAGKLMLAKEPKATAATESDLVPAKATNSCCRQLTPIPVHITHLVMLKGLEWSLCLP